MTINQDHLNLFNELFSEDATKRESFSSKELKIIAAFAFYLLERELYKDFNENAEQITVELAVLRGDLDKNLPALKLYHLARHFKDPKYSDLDKIIEEVLNKRCTSKEQYLEYVAFLYESSRSSFILKELEALGVFSHHAELNAIYEKTRKCHRAIKTIGLKIIDENSILSKPGFFSNGDTKEISLIVQLTELLGFINSKIPKP